MQTTSMAEVNASHDWASATDASASDDILHEVLNQARRIEKAKSYSFLTLRYLDPNTGPRDVLFFANKGAYELARVCLCMDQTMNYKTSEVLKGGFFAKGICWKAENGLNNELGKSVGASQALMAKKSNFQVLFDALNDENNTSIDSFTELRSLFKSSRFSKDAILNSGQRKSHEIIKEWDESLSAIHKPESKCETRRRTLVCRTVSDQQRPSTRTIEKKWEIDVHDFLILSAILHETAKSMGNGLSCERFGDLWSDDSQNTRRVAVAQIILNGAFKDLQNSLREYGVAVHRAFSLAKAMALEIRNESVENRKNSQEQIEIEIKKATEAVDEMETLLRRSFCDEEVTRMDEMKAEIDKSKSYIFKSRPGKVSLKSKRKAICSFSAIEFSYSNTEIIRLDLPSKTCHTCGIHDCRPLQRVSNDSGSEQEFVTCDAAPIPNSEIKTAVALLIKDLQFFISDLNSGLQTPLEVLNRQLNFSLSKTMTSLQSRNEFAVDPEAKHQKKDSIQKRWTKISLKRTSESGVLPEKKGKRRKSKKEAKIEFLREIGEEIHKPCRNPLDALKKASERTGCMQGGQHFT